MRKRWVTSSCFGMAFNFKDEVTGQTYWLSVDYVRKGKVQTRNWINPVPGLQKRLLDLFRSVGQSRFACQDCWADIARLINAECPAPDESWSE